MRKIDCLKLPLNAAWLLGAAIAASAGLPKAASADSMIAIASDVMLPHPGAKPAGATQAARQITVALVLPSRDPQGAAALAARVGRPGDSLYHQYLTPAEYASRFGASESAYAAVVAWAHAHGLVPGETFAAHIVLPLTGTVAALEAALGITLQDYIKPSGETFYAAAQPARLPAGIAGFVSGVVGLTSYSHFLPLLRKLPQTVHPNGEGSGPGSAFSAADLRTVYNIKPQAFTPGTQTLGVFEQGGFALSDVTTYLAKMKIAPCRLPCVRWMATPA